MTWEVMQCLQMFLHVCLYAKEAWVCGNAFGRAGVWSVARPIQTERQGRKGHSMTDVAFWSRLDVLWLCCHLLAWCLRTWLFCRFVLDCLQELNWNDWLRDRCRAAELGVMNLVSVWFRKWRQSYKRWIESVFSSNRLTVEYTQSRRAGMWFEDLFSSAIAWSRGKDWAAWRGWWHQSVFWCAVSV